MATSKTPEEKVEATSVEELVGYLKGRCSWPSMKLLLSLKGLKPGGGYPDLIARAAKGDADGEVISKLVRITYLNIIATGDRYVQLYVLSDDEVKQVLARLQSATVASSVFSEAYPKPLAQADLLSAPTDRTLCEVKQLSPDDFQLVFCRKQVIEEKTPIDSDSNPQVMAAVAPAGQFDRIVGYKFTPVQTFDVVNIRTKLKRIEVGLDLAHAGLKLEGPLAVFQLLGAVSLHLPELRTLYESQQPENVFPAIKGIYSARKTKDVNVTEIGIRTPSGAITRGKMPTPDDDIRMEKYHKNGADAVTQIYPYGVVATWAFSAPKGRATLKLWTSTAQAAASAPVHFGIEMSDAINDSDVVQAMNKVVKYLT